MSEEWYQHFCKVSNSIYQSNLPMKCPECGILFTDKGPKLTPKELNMGISELARDLMRKIGILDQPEEKERPTGKEAMYSEENVKDWV